MVGVREQDSRLAIEGVPKALDEAIALGRYSRTLATSGASTEDTLRRCPMSSTESQPRLIAAKFAGQRGPQFTQWAKEYLDAAAGKGDDFEFVLLREDQDNPPLPCDWAPRVEGNQPVRSPPA